MQLENYFSEIFKLIVFVSQQIDQWFDRINLLNDDLGSTFTTMLYGSIGGRKAYLKLEGAPNMGFVVIQGARWIEQENLAFGSPLLGPKGRTEFLKLTDHSQEVGSSGGSGSKKSTCITGDLGSIPGLGRSPAGGHGSPLQYSCLEIPYGLRSLVAYCPGCHKELDVAEWLSIA